MKGSIVPLKPVLLRRTTHDIPAAAYYNPATFLVSPQNPTRVTQEARQAAIKLQAHHAAREQILRGIITKQDICYYKPPHPLLRLSQDEVTEIMRDLVAELDVKEDKKDATKQSQSAFSASANLDPWTSYRIVDRDYEPDYEGIDVDLDRVFT